MRTEIAFGGLEHSQRDLTIPRYSQEGREVALQAAREGMVLLKNEPGVLPLDKSKVKIIAVIGPDAYPAVPDGGGSAQASAFHAVGFMEGLSDYLGTSAKVTYARGLPSLGIVANRTNFSTEEVHGTPGLMVEVFDNADLSGTPVNTHVEIRETIMKQRDLTGEP